MKTPYFSVQYLLREFAKGLGTKGLAGKKIDDACKCAEINPSHLDTLKIELIREPLTTYVNIHFAEHVLAQFENVIDIYLRLMKKVPQDCVNAELSQRLISPYFMTFAVATVCSDVLDGMRLTPKDIACSGKTLMVLVLENLEGSAQWKEFLADSSDSQKERLRAWSSGPGSELPESTSIASFGEPCKPGNSWGVFKARLFIARLWDHFFYRSGYVDLDMLKQHSAKECIEMLAIQLLTLLKKGGQKYQKITPLGLDLYELLTLRKGKVADGKDLCIGLLTQLKNQQERLDTSNESTYYYHWMNARYHLHSGDLLKAVEEYNHAFEQVIYRHVENAEQIIKEAMIAACRCSKPNKKFINRLRRMAVVMKIDFMAVDHNRDKFKAKPQEIESWEIAAFSKDFTSFFPKESFFVGASYPMDPYDKVGLWMFDEEEYSLDLEKPNKMFSIGSKAGLIKKMPQLVYFSYQGNLDLLRELLNAGADVNKLSSANESAILFAVQRMQVDISSIGLMTDALFQLLSNKPHKQSVLDTLTEKRKLSPLGCAVQTGRLDIVRKLLDMGASVDKRHNICGETPLYTALSLITHHTRPRLVEMVSEQMEYSEMGLQSIRAYSAGILPHDIEHLKKCMKKKESSSIYQSIFSIVKDNYKNNMAKYSSADGFREIAKLLIEYGADPNAKHNGAMLDYTPLMFAIELDEADLVEVMMEAKHHKPNFKQTCMIAETRERIGIERIIRNWGSAKVANILSEKLR